MKKLNFALAISLIFGMAVSCNNQKKSSGIAGKAATEAVAVKEFPMTGTFKGIMPAADCEGIKTVLTVNSDSTYTLVREYLGVKDGLFETSGIYHSLSDGLIELVKPSSGEKIYFKRVEKGFMLSDSLGTVNNGELAEYYILK